jgi:hypothetical protein
MRSPPDLAALQRGMLSVVVHPGTVHEALRAAPPCPEGRGRILPSATLRPEERLAIYHDMYLLRLEEALAADYPALASVLGDTFRALVRDYVGAHPSRSPTLARLGDALPAFLSGWQGVRRPPARWHVELARFERALARAEEAPDAAPLGSEATAAVPADAWATARLVPGPAVALLSFRHQVTSVYRRWSRDEAAGTPPRRVTHVVVFRDGDDVRFVELSRTARDLLGALVDGAALGDALVRARCLEHPEVSRWLERWVASGVFTAIVIP